MPADDSWHTGPLTIGPNIEASGYAFGDEGVVRGLQGFFLGGR